MSFLLKDGNLSDHTEISFVKLSSDVSKVINEVFSCSDSLELKDFNVTSVVNQLFTNEQSLVKINDVVNSVENTIEETKADIKTLIRNQTSVGEKSTELLAEVQKSVSQLFSKIGEIKLRAEESEKSVMEITRGIMYLDRGKRNLTAAVTTLNHLHMLSTSVESLNDLILRYDYKGVLNQLNGIYNVLDHFKQFNDVPQVKHLSEIVHKLRSKLCHQIMNDFRQTFSSSSKTKAISIHQLSDACVVLDLMESNIRESLLEWFVSERLEEYKQMFSYSEEFCWLDCIDKRYTWLKRHLIDFEERISCIFPQSWEVSERIAVQFCLLTRSHLAGIMSKRHKEITVSLLVNSIQKTVQFESLLKKRFNGLSDTTSLSVGLTTQDDEYRRAGDIGNPFINDDTGGMLEKSKLVAHNGNPFDGIIGQCFDDYFDIYLEGQEKVIAAMFVKFCDDINEHGVLEAKSEGSMVLSSAVDMFIMYKKCLVQCTQLARLGSIPNLTAIFRKYLNQYSFKVLLANLPKSIVNVATTAFLRLTSDKKGVSSLHSTKTDTGFLQNIHNFIKENAVSQRFSTSDIDVVCSVLITAEYCHEMVLQLESKLEETVEDKMKTDVKLTAEIELFHSITISCVHFLVQDLSSTCAVVLATMAKVNWLAIQLVGDQSKYVSNLISIMRPYVLNVRHGLITSRLHFTQFCTQFVSLFVSHFISNIHRCKSLGVVGVEQLLLDTHSLKMALLELPFFGGTGSRGPSSRYTKVVQSAMKKAEMLLKSIMSPHSDVDNFVKHFVQLLPEANRTELQKVLDMKGIRRSEHNNFLERFEALSFRNPLLQLCENH